MEGGVEGIYDAPTQTIWTRARRERGGRFKGMEQPERDVLLALGVQARSHEEWLEDDSSMREAFTYHLDPWDKDDELAQIVVDVEEERRLRMQLAQEPEFNPNVLKHSTLNSVVKYRLKVAQPMWEAKTVVASWETAGSSGSGFITVSNPTGVEMFQTWVLTPGTWTLSDFSWQGPRRKRTPADNRTITLNPVTTTHGGLTIRLDPMRRMFTHLDGSNAAAQVAGGYWFTQTIPPFTPKTDLPISVTDAPAGGARAELHQPRLYSRPWGDV